jgi:hypothetical protein
MSEAFSIVEVDGCGLPQNALEIQRESRNRAAAGLITLTMSAVEPDGRDANNWFRAGLPQSDIKVRFQSAECFDGFWFLAPTIPRWAGR